MKEISIKRCHFIYKNFKFLSYSSRHGAKKKPSSANFFGTGGGIFGDTKLVMYQVQSTLARRSKNIWAPVQRGWVGMIKRVFTHTRGMGLWKGGDSQRSYFLYGPYIKLYNSDHDLLNWDGLVCCKLHTKTNRSVQGNHLSLWFNKITFHHINHEKQ